MASLRVQPVARRATSRRIRPCICTNSPRSLRMRDRASGSPPAEELALSDAMLGYWSRFAKAGDPNGSAIAWPKYDAAGDSNLELATPIGSQTGLKMQKCDFWDSL